MARRARTAGLRQGLTLGLLVSSVLLPACYTNQTTGRRQLTGGLTRDEEVALGVSEGPKLAQEFGGEVQNPALRGYVNEIGQKLKDYTDLDVNGVKITKWDATPGPQRQWTFTLLDSDVINAFAIPGERVFISRGLADKLTNEADLAGVLGHEIGHVMARHTAERMGQSQYVGIGAAVIGAVAGATLGGDSTAGQALPALASAGGQLTVLRFSREQESEADKLGMRYMTAAGYNPKGQLEVMQVLEREAGSGGTPEWMSTHPLPKTRIQDVQRLLQTTYAYTQSGPQASQYGFYPERYQQRYLSIRAQEPAKPKATTPAGTGSDRTKSNLNRGRRSEVPVDSSGRARTLAAINLDDPTSWCAICRANAAQARADAEHAAEVHVQAP
jgi:predicted Zn-dependent protease